MYLSTLNCKPFYTIFALLLTNLNLIFMKKFAIFLISATLLLCSVNLNAQTDGCQFRFVLTDPAGFGWPSGTGITVIVDDVEYGFVTLPWGTPTTKDSVQVPLGEVNFLWTGDMTFFYLRHYFEIYNSLGELIYTSPNEFGSLPEPFFTYQNECNVGISNYTSKLLIYPNPANHVVHIAGENIANVKVFNNLGQLINTYHNLNSINVSSYNSGIYFFNITTIEGNIRTFKVVVTH